MSKIDPVVSHPAGGALNAFGEKSEFEHEALGVGITRRMGTLDPVVSVFEACAEKGFADTGAMASFPERSRYPEVEGENLICRPRGIFESADERLFLLGKEGKFMDSAGLESGCQVEEVGRLISLQAHESGGRIFRDDELILRMAEKGWMHVRPLFQNWVES